MTLEIGNNIVTLIMGVFLLSALFAVVRGLFRR